MFNAPEFCYIILYYMFQAVRRFVNVLNVSMCTVIPEINAWLKYANLQNSRISNKNAILLMRKQGIPVYDHYKMFKNRNYNNVQQKRLTKLALIKYRINFRNYGI